MRVAVQQRHRLFRDGLRELLDGERDLRVVGTVETPAELVAMCDGDGPDVAVLEWETGEAPPHGTARQLRERSASLRLVVLSGWTDEPDAEVVRALGAVVVRRSDGLAQILEAIISPTPGPAAKESRPARKASGTADDGVRATPAGHGVRATQAGHGVRATRAGLSPRERGILGLIGAGYTSQEIAARLHISRKTVDNHKQRMFVKLGVQNQAHAVAVAIRRGMLTPEPFVDVS